jgi:hypothetical protein
MQKTIEQKPLYPNRKYYEDKPLAVRLGAKFFPYHDKFGADITAFFLPSFLSINPNSLRNDVDYVRARTITGEAMEAFGIIGLLSGNILFGAWSYLLGRTITQWAEESSLAVTFKDQRENDKYIREEAQKTQIKIELNNKANTTDWKVNFNFDPQNLSIPYYYAIDQVTINNVLKTYGKDNETNAVSFRFYSQNQEELEEGLKNALGTDVTEDIFIMDFVHTSGTSTKEIVTHFQNAVQKFTKPAISHPEFKKPLIFMISHMSKNSETRSKIIEETA